MSKKFHINKHGVPAPCRATKGNCPLGGDESHFDSKEAAQEYADKVNAENHGTLPGASQYEMELNEFENELDEVTTTERAAFDSSLTYENPKIREKLEKEFGRDSFVVEVYNEDEDPINYTLYDSGGKVEDYYNALAETDESIHLWSPTEEDWQPRFTNSLRQHLRENEGPVKEVYGRKMRKTLDPYEGGEFMRDYVSFNEEFQRDRVELNTSDKDRFDRQSVSDEFKRRFGENAYVVEKNFPTESPLEYALYDGNSDNVKPYYNALEELNDSPYLWHEASNDWDNDFKVSLEKHLKENEGEAQEIYGVKVNKALDPNEGAKYLKSYVEFNEEFKGGFDNSPAGLHTSIIEDDFSRDTVKYLKSKFGDNSFVTQEVGGNPLSYSINAYDGRSEPYHEVRFESEFAGKVWDNEKDDWNEDLKKDLIEHLRNNEGEVKDIYGTPMRKVLDPNDGANFIREWARNR